MPRYFTKHRLYRTAAVAFGGNVGPVSQTFVRALELLHDGTTQVLATSSLYRSTPLMLPTRQGGQASPQANDMLPNYINAACTLRTQLGPVELLQRLLAIERHCGRRRGQRWGPRTLDLDLLCYDDRFCQRRTLILPHSGMPYRAFVLRPLLDLQVVHPWPHSALSVPDLLQGLNDRDCGILDKQLSWLVK